jgi:hypothetical protein
VQPQDDTEDSSYPVWLIVVEVLGGIASLITIVAVCAKCGRCRG